MINLQIAVAALAARGPHGQGLPICWWGVPGIAKTAMVSALALALQHHLEALASSLYEPSDFNGLPVIQGKSVRFVPARWAQDSVEAETALVFLDEITTATPATQKGLLRVINERYAGDLKLGKNVMFMLAANPASMGGYDLLPQVANRFGHIEIKITAKHARQWAKWRRGQSEDLLEGVTILTRADVDAQWDRAFAQASEEIATYIEAYPTALQEDPGEIGDRAGKAWCSMRTWDYVTSALASARIHGLSDEDTETFCGAFVGETAWSAFQNWLEEWQTGIMPDPKEFLAGGCKGWEHDPQRIDRTQALLEACVEATISAPESTRANTSKAMWCWMTQLFDTVAKDILVVPFGLMVDAGLAGTKESGVFTKKITALLV